MDKTTKPVEEKKPVETQKPVEQEKPAEVKKVEPKKEEPAAAAPAASSASSSSSALTWIIVILVFLALIAGGIFLGLGAERQYGTALLTKLPKNLVTKWLISNPEPTPMIALEFKPSPKTTPATGSALLKTTPTGGEEPTPPADELAESAYILSFSNTRKLVTDDLTALTPWELKVARNEIYARHGRPFVSKDLSCYFAKQAWYTIDPEYTDKSLSSLEVANAVFILDYENETGSPVMNKDGGCK